MSRSVSQFPETDVDIHFTKNKKFYEIDLEICFII